MEIHLVDEYRIRLENRTDAFAFEPGGATSLSPFHLLAASLATCTYSVLIGYAEAADLPLADLAIDVGWDIGGEPYRVTGIVMELDWPGLPTNRRDAARRAAAQCTIHHTLESGSPVQTRVRDPERAGKGSGSEAGLEPGSQAGSRPEPGRRE